MSWLWYAGLAIGYFGISIVASLIIAACIDIGPERDD